MAESDHGIGDIQARAAKMRCDADELERKAVPAARKIITKFSEKVQRCIKGCNGIVLENDYVPKDGEPLYYLDYEGSGPTNDCSVEELHLQDGLSEKFTSEEIQDALNAAILLYRLEDERSW